MTDRWWFIGWMSFLAAVGLPIVGHWARAPIEGACTVDGTAIDPLLRVRVASGQNGVNEFCSLRCAEWWLAAKGVQPDAIYVTDEASGEEVDVAAAYFVRSRVNAKPPKARTASVPGSGMMEMLSKRPMSLQDPKPN